MNPTSPSRRAFSPGKLVLLGEYAVLDGAPGIVVAIDHGVQCSVFPAEQRIVEVPDDARFAAAALDIADAPAARYHFEATGRLPPTWSASQKPGFGGSASATVAAITAARPEWDTARRLTAALATHHRVQGSGSGIDIAAAVYGGLLRFEKGSVRPLATELVRCVVWSGKSASTAERIRAYQAFRPRDWFVAESARLVDGFPADPIGAFHDAYTLLDRMAQEAHLDWSTPEHAAIRRLAVLAGGAAKPSGAGGGDCAVALFPNSNCAAEFRAACHRAGFLLIDVDDAGPASIIHPS
jgi:phosphomevalonate kinase